jgi:hypothetical protein
MKSIRPDRTVVIFTFVSALAIQCWLFGLLRHLPTDVPVDTGEALIGSLTIIYVPALFARYLAYLIGLNELNGLLVLFVVSLAITFGLLLLLGLCIRLAVRRTFRAMN